MHDKTAKQKVSKKGINRRICKCPGFKIEHSFQCSGFSLLLFGFPGLGLSIVSKSLFFCVNGIPRSPLISEHTNIYIHV